MSMYVWVKNTVKTGGKAICLVALSACGDLFVPPYYVHPERSVLASSVSAVRWDDLQSSYMTFNASAAQIGLERFMAVRIDSNASGRKKQQELAIVAVDANHQPRGPYQVLSTPHPDGHRPTAEDPRLFAHEGALYVMYSATPVARGEPTQRRMHMGRLHIDDSGEVPVASLAWARQLDIEDNAIEQAHWEKNWTPFTHNGAIHLLYRANPPLVLRMAPSELADIEIEALRSPARPSLHAALPHEQNIAHVQLLTPPDQTEVEEVAGKWRGGTPALFAPEIGEYVTFFHTRARADYRSGYGANKYYMMGFYTFAAEPPFQMRSYIKEPLQVPEFGDDAPGTTRIVFPGGLIDEPNQYIVSFGREDRDIGAAAFDKDALFRRLQPVDANQVLELTVRR